MAGGNVMVGVVVIAGGNVMVGGKVLVVVGEGVVTGGGHLGRNALDHLWLASTCEASVVLLAVVYWQLPPHW